MVVPQALRVLKLRPGRKVREVTQVCVRVCVDLHRMSFALLIAVFSVGKTFS